MITYQSGMDNKSNAAFATQWVEHLISDHMDTIFLILVRITMFKLLTRTFLLLVGTTRGDVLVALMPYLKENSGSDCLAKIHKL